MQYNTTLGFIERVKSVSRFCGWGGQSVALRLPFNPARDRRARERIFLVFVWVRMEKDWLGEGDYLEGKSWIFS